MPLFGVEPLRKGCVDDGQRGKKFWEKQKVENDFFGSVLPVSLHLPSLQLMPAGKSVPIAKTSRGATGAVSQEVRRHWFRSTEPSHGDRLGYQLCWGATCWLTHEYRFISIPFPLLMSYVLRINIYLQLRKG